MPRTTEKMNALEKAKQEYDDLEAAAFVAFAAALADEAEAADAAALADDIALALAAADSAAAAAAVVASTKADKLKRTKNMTDKTETEAIEKAGQEWLAAKATALAAFATALAVADKADFHAGLAWCTAGDADDSALDAFAAAAVASAKADKIAKLLEDKTN